MAKKEITTRLVFLNSFVELRRKDPLKYPRAQSVISHSKLSVRKFSKEFKSTKEFYKEGEEHLRKTMPKSEQALLSEKNKAYYEGITKEQCIDDLRKLQESHPLKFITRTFYRNEGSYSDSTWSQYFGTFHEFKRGAKLELTRQQHQLEKHIAKHASNEHYKEWFSLEIMPYHNKYRVKQMPGKIKTFLIGSDLHDEEVDEFCLEVFIDTALKMQPDHIVLNGDIFDLYEFSKYGKDPRKIRIKERFDFVKERVFGPLRKACPNAQIDFIMGNHEFRLLRMLADYSPHIRVLLSDICGLSFSKIFGLDEFKINWVSKLDLGVFSKQDVKNELKKNYKVFYNCFVVCHEPDTSFGLSGTNGHHHKANLFSFNSPINGEMTWTQTPGMHVSDAEYLNGMSKWNTGFLVAHVNTETREVIQNVIQTHEWSVVNGILYERKEKV